MGFLLLSMKKEDLVQLGFASHPHGIRGEVELRLFNMEDSILEDGMRLFLYPSNPKSQISPGGEEWVLSRVRFGNKVIATLDGIKDRTHLETLLPFEIYFPRSEFPEPEDGEIYLIDLIGLPVISEEGEKIGVLKSFDDNGMQILFNVQMDSGEIITLPYVDNFFPKIDMEEKTITMVRPDYTE